MESFLKKLDHVGIAAPTGSEYEAREFYGGILGMEEIEKPETLQKNGGVWFRSSGFELHIGIDEPFTPARKAHPAFEVDSLDDLMEYLDSQEVSYTPDDQLPGAKRIYVSDPFGNRLEFLEWLS